MFFKKNEMVKLFQNTTDIKYNQKMRFSTLNECVILNLDIIKLYERMYQ